MKTLYKIRPKKFRDIWFINKTKELDHYFSDYQWVNGAELEVYYKPQDEIIFCKINDSHSSKVLFEDSFVYKNEEEALNWLFNSLEFYGQTHKNKNNKESVFDIPYTLYHYLGGNYGDYGTRGIVTNFLNYYKQHGTNLVVLMEITALGKMDPMMAPKMMTERIMKKAPILSRIITDFFVDRSLNDNKILTYFSDNISY